jgi:hypothetical protein
MPQSHGQSVAAHGPYRHLLVDADPVRLAPRNSFRRDAQFDTIRLNLIGVAARETGMVTRIEPALPTAYPHPARVCHARPPKQPEFPKMPSIPPLRLQSPAGRMGQPERVRQHQPNDARASL